MDSIDLINLFDYLVQEDSPFCQSYTWETPLLGCQVLLIRIETSEPQENVVKVGDYLRTMLTEAKDDPAKLPDLTLLRKKMVEMLECA